jgi:hypothetical protein
MEIPAFRQIQGLFLQIAGSMVVSPGMVLLNVGVDIRVIVPVVDCKIVVVILVNIIVVSVVRDVL